MATLIVEQETRLATLDAERAGVVGLDEWRVVDSHGGVHGSWGYKDIAQGYARRYDAQIPNLAPHRVMRVCLTPTTPEADHA